ncbi:hypothetical protein K443DRAFT_291416 [Laccaria amethystina LaAM-08-1]|uniref:Uncharacterized protein n=1 Tax=Laccaria amethystina LaAM-08-1 TaxID=1095629 RepID=A0A0C9X4X4_9AGAR|nr:hypothetical protein K443DRAFT_291416 [Laccaria amethystina LaAM-08-1]
MKRVERQETIETQQQMVVMHQIQIPLQQQQPSRGGSMLQLPRSQRLDRSDTVNGQVSSSPRNRNRRF